MSPKWFAAALGVAWILAGFVTWGVGVIGIGIGLEDRCLQVADDNDYGASSQSASIWPPHFTCELTGPDDPTAADQLAVDQVGAALLRTGWAIGFPVVWIVIGALLPLRRPWAGVLPKPRR